MPSWYKKAQTKAMCPNKLMFRRRRIPFKSLHLFATQKNTAKSVRREERTQSVFYVYDVGVIGQWWAYLTNCCSAVLLMCGNAITTAVGTYVRQGDLCSDPPSKFRDYGEKSGTHRRGTMVSDEGNVFSSRGGKRFTLERNKSVTQVAKNNSVKAICFTDLFKSSITYYRNVLMPTNVSPYRKTTTSSNQMLCWERKRFAVLEKIKSFYFKLLLLVLT